MVKAILKHLPAIFLTNILATVTIRVLSYYIELSKDAEHFLCAVSGLMIGLHYGRAVREDKEKSDRNNKSSDAIS